jgi:hypothetical protein
MSTDGVTTQEILNAIRLVPAERWGEVLHAIESFQIAPVALSPAPSPVKTGTDLRGSDLIGIWADRADLGSSQEFARGLRRQAEQRNIQGRSDAAGH